MRKAILLIIVLFSFLSCEGYAVTYYNKASGVGALQTLSNWGVNTDGSGTAPTNFTTSGNVFNLYNGSSATITAAWVITGGTLNVGNGSAAMNLTIPLGSSLTGTGIVNVSASATLTLQNATNPTLGTLNVNSTVNFNGTGAQTITATTYGNLVISGTRSGTPTITLNGTTTVANTFSITLSGSVSYATSGTTFVYSALTGGKTVESLLPYNNLTLNNTSGTNTANGDLAITGVLTTAAGGTLDMSTYALSVSGSPVNGGIIKTQNTGSNPISTGKVWGGTVQYYAASGGQTIRSGTYATLTLSNTSGTSTADGVITMSSGTLNVAAGGTLDMATYAIAGSITTVNNNGTIISGSTTNPAITSGDIWGGTLVFDVPTGGQYIPAGTYNNLKILNTSGTQTAVGILTVNGTLTTTSGGTLAMGGNALAGTLTAANDGTITTTSTTNPAIPTGKDWSGTTGTVIFASSTGGQTVPGGVYKNLTFSNSSSTVTASGNLTVNGTLTTTSGGTLAMSSYLLLGTLTSVVNNGTISTACTTNPPYPGGKDWTGTTGQITFALTTGGQCIPSGTYKSIRLNNTSGADTALSSISANGGTVRTTAGGTLYMGTTNILSGTSTITNSGTILTLVPTSVSATPIPSGRSISGTVIYGAPAGSQTIVAETSYRTLTLSNSSGTNTSAGNITVTTLNTTAGGTLDMTSSYRLLGATYLNHNGIIKTAVPTSVSSTPIPRSKIWGGTVEYYAAAGSQTIVTGTYNNLTLSNTSGTNTAGSTLTVNGTLTTAAGGTLDMTSSYRLVGTLATINNNGTIKTSVTSTTSTTPIPSGKNWGTAGLILYGATSGSQTVVSGIYYGLKVGNTSGTNTASGTLTVNGTLTTTAGGTLNMSTFAMTGAPVSVNNPGKIVTSSTNNPALPAGEDWSGGATAGSVTFALATGGQYVPGGIYKTLTFSNTSGTNLAVGDITENGVMTITAGGTLDMGTANELNGTGTFTNNGTIKTSVAAATSATPLPPGLTWTGTIVYGAATGAQSVVDGTYTNLLLSNTSGINTASGDITVNTGTMTTIAGGTLDMGGTNILSGTGTFTNNGTIVTSVPTYISATPIPAGKSWGGTIFYGEPTGDQTIVSATAYNNLKVGNSSGINIAAANLVVNGALTTTAGGTLDLSTRSLSGSLSSISGGGTILTANTSTAPISSGKTWTQLINYDNAAGGQTIVSGTYNGGLTNSNTSGTNTIVAAGAVSISGSLTLEAGSVLNDNGVTMGLSGSIAGTGAHYGSGAISMNSSGNTISGVTLGNLTLNNAGTFSLTDHLAVNGVLKLTAGRLDIDVFNLKLGTSASVSGTFSSSNMIIANGGGQVQKQYSATGAFAFPIGDNVPSYAPITVNVTSGTVGAGAYVWADVVNSKHPQNANTTNYLNRYWSTGVSGITSPVYSVSATYVTGDVTGTEASISAGQYPLALPWIKFGSTNTTTHTLSATGITAAASDFSGISTANPSISVLPASTTLCSGASVTMTVTPTGNPTFTYTWAPATGLSATTGNIVTATPVSTVTATYVYTVTATDGNGFIATTTASVTVNPLPADITGSASVCKGTATTLSSATTGGTWSSGTTSVATVGTASGVVTGVNVGTAIITYKLSTGCSDTDVVIVNALPSAITGTTTLCANGTTTLSDASGGLWSSSNSAVATIGSTTGVVSGVSGGTATITFTGGSSCIVTASVLVNPILPTTGVPSACSGSSTTLSNGTAGGTWSSSNTLVATVGSGTGVVTAVAVGTAIVTYKLSTGCSDTTLVTINPVPTAITGTMSVCAGSTTTLSNTGTGTWSSSNTAIAAAGSTSGVITGVSAGTATITFTGGSSCIVTASLLVNPLPAAISGTTPICAGLTTTFSDAGGGSWTSSTSTIATVGSGTGLVTGVAAGTATISYILSTGCVATKVATINPLPSAISGATNICLGSTTTLSNTGGGTWTSSNTTVATIGSSGIITTVAAGTTTISYTLATGCVSSMVFTVNALPSAISGTRTVCASATTTLSNTGGGTWASSVTTIAVIGSSTGVVTGVAAGTSTITYTLGTGCRITSVATVYALPSAISGTKTVCAGLTTTLSDAGGGTWSSSNTSVATVGTSVGLVSALAAGTTTISYTLATGCRATSIVTVNPLPVAISGISAICEGSTAAMSDATAGGSWISSDITTASIGSSSGVVTGLSAGALVITYKLGTGCIATLPVTINDVPPAITGVTDMCEGFTTALSNTTTGGVWTNYDPAVASIGSASGIVTGISAGTSTVTYTDVTTGCSANTGITVNGLPTAITGNTYVCEGQVTTLVDTTIDGIWTSSNTGVADVDTLTGDVTGISAGTSIITYELSTGCITTKVFTVITMPAAITGIMTVCNGLTTTLSNTATGGVWSSFNSSVATVGSSTGVVTGRSVDTVTVTYSFGYGCEVTTNVTVNPLPVAISGITTVCTGLTTTLSDATSGGTWSSSKTAVATINSSTGVLTGVAAGTATITYKLPTGCISTTTINVNALPSPIAGTTSVCPGSTTTLSNSGGGTWSSGNTAIATVGSSTGVVASVATGTASITYSLGTGCTSTSVVTVLSTPGVITGTKAVCAGLTTTLSNSGGGTWSTAATTIATVGSSSGVVTGVSGGTAAITYRLSTGCTSTTLVTVNALPSAISGTTTVCRGATTTLSNTGGGTWSSSATAVATIGSGTGVVTPMLAGTSTVTYTLSTGCLITTTVTVRNAPALASATNNGPICAGATLSLSANTPTDVAGYSWSGPVVITGATLAAASVPSATTTASGTYTVTVNNGAGAGCSVSYTTTAVVNALPTAAPTNNSPMCPGGTVTLSANPGGSANRYTWSGAGLSSTTAQNPTVAPSSTSTYSLTVSYNTALPGCSPVTVYTTTVTVTTAPTAAPTNNGPKCSGTAVTLTANPGGSANTYVWKGPNLSSSTAQNPTATPTVTTTYSLTVSYGTGNPGCSPSTVYTTTVTVIPTGYWQGVSDTMWSNTANWCGGVPSASTDVVIPGGVKFFPVIDAKTTGTANNLTLQSSTTLTVGGGVLQIAGAISNSGTLTAASGTVEMNGTSTQTIAKGTFAGNLVNNFTIDNAKGGVVLSDKLMVTGIVKATKGNLTTSGNLTLLSSAKQTALIDGSGAGDVLGDVTMQCYLDTGYGYRYISSPFAATKIGGLAAYVNLADTFPTVYRYDESLKSAGWVADTAAGDTLKPFRGYAANFGTSMKPKTIALTGTVNNGNISASLFNNDNTFTKGFNLIGNPYPSPIDWTAKSGWTKTDIDDAVYYFNSDDTNQYTGAYSSYVGGVSSDGIASNIIPAMQGFFVHVSKGKFPVKGTLSVTNSVRVNNLSTVFHRTSAGPSRPLLRLDAGYTDDSKRTDPVVVYFDEMATEGFNPQLDAVKLLNTDTKRPNLYTIPDDNTKLSIQALPLAAAYDSMSVVPLGLTTERDGLVVFNVRNMEHMPAGMHVYLFDTKTGTSQDMGANPQYKISLSKGKYEHRFFLMFSRKDKQNLPIVNNNLNAYSSRGKLFVYLLAGKGEVMITNMLGQQVWKEGVSGSGYHEMQYSFINGVYIVTLYSDMGKQSRKLFIGNE